MPNQRTHYEGGITFGRSGATVNFRVGPDAWVYSFVPATLDRDGYCAAQQLAAAGNLLLNGALVVNGVGIADVARRVGIYSAADLSAITFTVYGYSIYGEPQTSSLAGPNNTTVKPLKAFSRVTRVAASAAVGSNVEVGTVDDFGLPMRIYDAGGLLACKWDSTLAQNAATVVAGDATTASATTGDPRGIVTFASTAANGARRAYLQGYFDPTSETTEVGVRQDYARSLV